MEPEPFGWVIGRVEYFFLGTGKEEQRRLDGVWVCQGPTLLSTGLRYYLFSWRKQLTFRWYCWVTAFLSTACDSDDFSQMLTKFFRKGRLSLCLASKPFLVISLHYLLV